MITASVMKGLTKNNENSFINPTPSEEIEDIVSSFERNKGTGSSSIPIKILKDLNKTVSKPLADLINLSFNFIEATKLILISKKR